MKRSLRALVLLLGLVGTYVWAAVPRVPAPAIWPKRRRASRGSKRSLAKAQKPESITGPSAMMWI